MTDPTRAALSQTEPDVDDILQLAAIIRRVDGNNSLGAAALAEKILSHPNSRWTTDRAHRQPVPPEPGEVQELVAWMKSQVTVHQVAQTQWAKRFVRAAELLAQRPPQPVLVSECLPGQGDCDAEGRCWIHMPDIGTAPSWRLVDPREIGPYHTHWLPAHALPLPGEVEHG